MNISLSTEKNREIFDGILCKNRNFDILKREIVFAGRPALLYMIDGFVKEDLLEKILESFYKLKPEDAETEENFKRAHIPYSSLSTEKAVDTVITGILSGKTALMVEGFENAFIMELRSYPQRDTAEPDRDKVMRGSRDGFTETLTLNAALVRRRIRHRNLSVEYHSVGKISKTDVAVCYLADRVDKNILEKVRKRIDGADIDAMTMCQEDMANIIDGKMRWNPFPKYKFSERPDVAAAQIMEGDIIVLIDNTPTAMILPATIFDIAEDANDYYFPPLTGAYLRITRLLTMFVTLFVTPLWLLALHYPESVPEMFRFVLIDEKPNVPVVLQLLMLEFIIDGLKLSSLNTPNMLSSAFSIIAGIIVSDFAVQSGWFCAQTLLYMAFVAMANYSQPGYELGYAIKFMRMLLLVLVELFGIWGLIAGTAFTVWLILSTKIEGKKGYFWPVVPFSFKGMGRLLFRLK